MSKLELKQISSLEKVFLEKPIEALEYNNASVLKGEEFAYQISYHADESFECLVTVKTDIPAEVMVYNVENVPSEFPTYKDADKRAYLSLEPGMYPDVLAKLRNNTVKAVDANKAVWINIKQNKDIQAGIYPITVTFENEEKQICESVTFNLEVIGVEIPKQKLIFTQWFHGDCIATYYKEEIFSESHWRHLESFIKMAVENGINMLLTPVFTPPLDTAVGGERPTIQLVDVYIENGKYSFGFEKLIRWINLCKKCGVEYFEISHLFTQWGAAFTPKIMALEDGEEKRIFGWDVSATSDKYKEFINAFLPELVKVLKAEGIAENTYFHVSDEPHLEHFDSYVAALNIIKPHIEGFKIIDALSDYDFYKTGVVECPVASTQASEEFLTIKDLWLYYCCGQVSLVSNRLFAMPSYRNRIMGIQLYKYKIAGFLHWGYNFYYSQFSKYPINPYQVTDAGYAFPSGDAFSVYPGEDGEAVASLRLKVFFHGLQDMRALSLLETIIGYDEVMKIVEEWGEIKLYKYPFTPAFIIGLREKINKLIKDSIK